MAVTTINSPRNKAMDYLSRREHSRYELEIKLAEKGFLAAEIEQALDRLVSENLLNDLRFAQAYFRHRISKGFGPIKIRLEIHNKGVIKSLIKSAEQYVECDWQAQLEQVSWRKFGDLPIQNLKQKQKRIRFLLQRGFVSQDIMRLFA